MVSVLLAAYQGAAYLPEQLASLQAQEGANFRVLWQDDGSTDDSAALLTALSRADGRFRPGLQQGMRLGASGNFRSLLRQDDAPYAALCDQDDRWHPQKLARSLAAMQAAEKRYGPDTPLLVHHDCRLVSASGDVLHGSFFRHQGWDGRAASLPPLLVQNNVTGCTCLMNAPLRALVANRLPEELPQYHDWFLALTAAAFGRIIFLPDALVDYRQHGANVMGASRSGLLRRGVTALRAPRAARERIAKSYGMARIFRAAFEGELPAEARRILDDFSRIEALPKMQRLIALRRGGFLMQSSIARLGAAVLG